MQAIQRFIEVMRKPQRPIHEATRNALLTGFWIVLAFAIVALIAPRGAWALDSCYTGSWYDPDAPGEGISVEVLDDVVLVYFYRNDGAWFVLQGDDTALSAYQLWNGGIEHIGNGAFVPTDPNTAVFAYDLQLDLESASPGYPIPWCLREDCADVRELQRLTQPIACE